MLATVLLALVVGCSEGERVTAADRRAFCKLATQPEPEEMDEALTGETARRRLDARRRIDTTLAAIEAVAPRDIHDEVSVYRREVQTYLRALATGPGDPAAEHRQFEAGTAVRAYVEDHCS